MYLESCIGFYSNNGNNPFWVVNCKESVSPLFLEEKSFYCVYVSGCSATDWKERFLEKEPEVRTLFYGVLNNVTVCLCDYVYMYVYER